ncbi:MAG TPA: DUF559 domain-containing protein [Propionibacteriaceae bacterium]|nr:DUF559 domain-containing protein [Propionibacteriaceae bacterium]
MTSVERPNVMTRARARAIGLPLTELLGPGFDRLFYDTYVAAPDTSSLKIRAATVMQRLPAASHVSHHTAVRLWGGVAPDSPDIHVSMGSREARCRRRGIAAHLAGEAARTVSHRALTMSTPVQSFLDLASVGVSLIDLVIAGDSLVKAIGLDPGELVAAAEGWLGRNAKRARRAAALVRAGVDSPMETRLRLLIVFAGLPEPEVNLVLRDSAGSWQWRFDLCYRPWKVIVEYDGRQHAFDDRQWSHDLDRREELERLGWRLIVIQSNGIYERPLRTLQRVRAALEERGAAGLPKKFNQEWTRHFASRG